jgi:hypothetical protein
MICNFYQFIKFSFTSLASANYVDKLDGGFYLKPQRYLQNSKNITRNKERKLKVSSIKSLPIYTLILQKSRTNLRK